MMIAKDTRFSAVKAFVHWWLLGVAGLLPAAWLAETMPTRELQALCYGAGLVWCLLAAGIVGRRDGYTKLEPPATTAAMTAASGVLSAGWAVHPYLTDPDVADSNDFWSLYEDD